MLLTTRVASWCSSSRQSQIRRLSFATTAALLISSSSFALQSGSIEVERKYLPPSDVDALKKKVVELGGKSLGEVHFTDTYYDTLDCLLSRQDEWLRQRDDAWELKVPAGEAFRSGGERTSFREIEGAAQVSAELQRRHGIELSAGLNPTTLAACGLIPFASFGTTRAKFTLRGLALDLDLASFGHGVLEIERMVNSSDEIADAEQRIAQLADEIGAKPLSGTQGGKLETYIRRHAPNVLAALIEAGILSSSS